MNSPGAVVAMNNAPGVELAVEVDGAQIPVSFCRFRDLNARRGTYHTPCRRAMRQACVRGSAKLLFNHLYDADFYSEVRFRSYVRRTRTKSGVVSWTAVPENFCFPLARPRFGIAPPCLLRSDFGIYRGRGQ
jgi:hypothetical protein